MPITELENDSESIWVKVFANKTSHFVASWYRPPGSTSEEFQLFREQLDYIRTHHKGKKLPSAHVLGDFSFKDIDWPDSNDRYHKLRKTFSKFYRRHYELVSKFNVGLKTLLHQGLSEPEFYGDLVYKFKKIVGRVDFSDQFRKIIVRYKRIGYNINIMRQSACLVFYPITVNNFASLFNCTPVGRASDSMMAPT